MLNINPVIPMLSLCGNPTRERLYAFMKGLCDMGIRSAMLYGRDGVESGYLCGRWFDVIGDCLGIAEELGMQLWLYDEFNWPSGQAGGRVQAAGEDYILHNLKITCENGVFSAETVPTGRADLLSQKAVELFIRLTHQEYKKRFGKYFGKVFLGIFSDEPSYAYGTGNGFSEGTLPYYDGLFDDYRNTYGSDCLSDLEKHCLYGSDGTAIEHIVKLCGERFRENYIGRISAWCKENGLLFTGHMMCDDSLPGNVGYSGDLLSVLSDMSYPGIDEIYSLTPEHNLWLLAVAEYAASRSEYGAMCELFALGPCDMTLSERVRMVYSVASFGVSGYFIAMSHLDKTGNLKKKDYFNDFSPDSPDSRAMRIFCEEAQKAKAIARKKRKVKIRLRYAYTAMARMLYSEKANEAHELYLRLGQDLYKKQHLFGLLSENEKCADAECIFNLDENGLFEENSGKRFTSSEEAAAFADTRVRKEVTVFDADTGKQCENVLVRSFSDGSYLILDGSSRKNAAGRRVILSTPSGKREAFLPAFGVLYSEEMPEKLRTVSEYPIPGLTAEFPECGCFRPIFPMGKRSESFYAEAPFYAVLSVRTKNSTSCPGFTVDNTGTSIGRADHPTEVYLDGVPVTAARPCRSLPDGFSALYADTAPIFLSKGAHTVSVSDTSTDFKYLPCVILSGEFMTEYGEDGAGLTEKKKTVSEAQCFFGKAVFSVTLDIPETDDVYFVSLDSRLYTELSLNGEALGGRALLPERWEIPKKYNGQSVTLTFSAYSDESPLFGPTEEFEKNDPACAGWCRGYCTHGGVFSLGKRISLEKRED